MTPAGYGALPTGAALLALGLACHWPPVAVLGAGILSLAAGSFAYVLRRPRLSVLRSVEPRRVEKGQPAKAVLDATNLSRRSLPPTAVEQLLGDRPVRDVLPRLRPGERITRTLLLPTSERGTYDVGPLEVVRADPFGLCRTVQRLGFPQRISVHPRMLPLKALPTGVSRNLEGPSSDTSPQGTVTFHRLREYVVGDDLRTVHWPTTARVGQLVVRHNVDTAQPYSVVLLDLDPDRYPGEIFEEAVDVATSSVCASLSAGRAPVQLRTTTGERVGGPSDRRPAPMVDFLTDVRPDRAGGLGAELVKLRRDRGGTALVVVTGRLDMNGLPGVAGLRRQFDLVVVVSLVAGTATYSAPAHPKVKVVAASNADEAARRWNAIVSR